MAVQISVIPSAQQPVDPFFNGNLVTHGQQVVLVLGPSEAGLEAFSGICLSTGRAVVRQDWPRRAFRQFIGKITLEGFK